MAQQTINVGAAPNDGTGTPLRTAFQYTNSNFSELYTAVGPSGNNIVVPGNATITGDLTVDTSTLKVDSANNRVGIGLTSPNRNLSIYGASNSLIHFTTATTGPLNTDGFTFGVETDSSVALFNSENTPFNFYVNSTLGMTLNSTGLGVGASPSYKLDVQKTSDGTVGYFRRIGATINPALTLYCNETGNTVGFGTDYAGSVSPAITFTTAGAERVRIDASGNLLVGIASGTQHTLLKGTTVNEYILNVTGLNNACASFYSGDTTAFNAANTCLKIASVAATGRSINASGTVNASGADYAEYMTKASDFVLAKGDVAGIDANGKLTNVFADAVSFVVKSTDPSYVGNDNWGADLEGADLEAARQLVDRIAFAGQVPVNVTGAKAGDYIVPIVSGTGIKGQAVSNPTFEQYQLAVGKVISIEADGRARIIVKVA